MIAAALLAMQAAPADATDIGPLAQVRAAVDFLNDTWGRPADWSGIEPWQRFVVVDELIDYQRRTGDQRWRQTIADAVRNRRGLALNDDDVWAVIASVHAWQLDGDPALLAYATSTYRRIVTAYWDNHCGGGLWWDHGRTYKNAITNELLIDASTQLFMATGQTGYKDWALRAWSWFAQSSMIGPDSLVNDGLDAACHNNHQPRFTYNQGVLVGSLSELTRITGDAQYRSRAVETAIATTRDLASADGILREPVPTGSDGLIFKGIFAYHLGHLLDDLPDGPDRSQLTAWTRLNASAVWRSSALGTRGIGSDWSADASASSAAAQASGIAMLLAQTK